MLKHEYTSRRALWLNKLTEEVVHGLCQKIKTGELEPGKAVPDRDALMAEFVTSTSVIDRALDRLHEEGVIAVAGDGFIVASAQPSDTPFTLPDRSDVTIADVRHIVEMRIGLESEAAGLAATNRNDAELNAINEAAVELEATAASGIGTAQADFRFHMAIGVASANPYIQELISYLGPLFIPRMRLEQINRAEAPDDKNLEDAMSEHQVIVDAIAAQDSGAARAAMRAHLGRTLEMLQQL